MHLAYFAYAIRKFIKYFTSIIKHVFAMNITS